MILKKLTVVIHNWSWINFWYSTIIVSWLIILKSIVEAPFLYVPKYLDKYSIDFSTIFTNGLEKAWKISFIWNLYHIMIVYVLLTNIFVEEVNKL